jgi:ABC-type lipoprotein export system ATPase subunit
LLPTLTVTENISLPILLNHRALSETEILRVRELLEAVGLESRADYFPHQLSGGEMQRVALARALIHNPGLVIADEPTGNLDSSSADSVLKWLRRISEEMGHAVLMATHSREAAAFASRVIEMRDGHLLI